MRWALPALAVVLAGCGSSQSHLIAFTSTRDGNAEVYVVNADGTGVRDLTNDLAQDGEPSWSPDGKTIAFVSARSGDAQIWVMKPDGTSPRRVTHDNWNDMAPVWSPDGTKLAFMCTTATPFLVTEICDVNADGSGEHRLTVVLRQDNLYPIWSRDGRSVLYTSRRGQYGVYEVAAGGGVERLIEAGAAEPALARDGTLALLRVASSTSLVVAGKVVAHGRLDSPAWSPDGTRIAFVDGHDVDVVDRDGSRRRLTHGPGASLSPVWAPDGKTIAFERTRGSHSDVYVVRADGSGLRDLTRGTGRNGGPQWRP